MIHPSHDAPHGPHGRDAEASPAGDEAALQKHEHPPVIELGTAVELTLGTRGPEGDDGQFGDFSEDDYCSFSISFVE